MRTPGPWRARAYWFEFDQDGAEIDTDVPAQDEGAGASELSAQAWQWLEDNAPEVASEHIEPDAPQRGGHTPGPWSVFEDEGGTFVITGNDPQTADSVAKVYHTAQHPERANLIAAAPDMLEALRGCINAANTEETANSPAIHAARAALARATA